MFGKNDNTQNNTAPAADNKQADGSISLPPSPYLDSQDTQEGANSGAAPAKDQTNPTPPAAGNDQPSAPNSDALVNLKEQALTSLAPLVGHLDQTPEEKFKTTMMLIQASDNSSLVKDAYDAANQISDEKARAQALLDVINEINYFTQNGKNEDKA